MLALRQRQRDNVIELQGQEQTRKKAAVLKYCRGETTNIGIMQ